jgi:copper(I)-binding protein
MKLTLRAAFAASLLALGTTFPAMAGETSLGSLTISDPWARPNLPNRPTAAYMAIANTSADGDRLVAASSPLFETIEIHTVIMEGDVMKMQPIEAIDVGPGAEAALEPGGLHLMLFGAAQAFREGESFPLTLRFEAAGEVTVDVAVRKPDLSGGHGHGHGHGHGQTN